MSKFVGIDVHTDNYGRLIVGAVDDNGNLFVLHDEEWTKLPDYPKELVAPPTPEVEPAVETEVHNEEEA